MDKRILKYLQEGLSEPEKASLLNDAQSNEDLKRELRDALNISALTQLHSSQIDRAAGEAQLQRFKARIRRNKLTTLGATLLRYAAVMLIGIAGALAFSRYYADKKDVAVMQTLTVPQGQHCSITLSDGSKVWVNAGSVLRYPSRFTDERRIELDGEALFDVAKNRKLPFIVVAKDMCIKALGTRFNIRGYAKEPLAVSLLHGSVNVYKADNEDKGTVLHPGEELTMGINGITLGKVDDDVTAWKDGLIVFKAATIHEIINRLQAHYGVRITVKDPSIMRITYSGKFRQSDGVMGILNVISRVQYFKVIQKRDNNEIELCNP